MFAPTTGFTSLKSIFAQKRSIAPSLAKLYNFARRVIDSFTPSDAIFHLTRASAGISRINNGSSVAPSVIIALREYVGLVASNDSRTFNVSSIELKLFFLDSEIIFEIRSLTDSINVSFIHFSVSGEYSLIIHSWMPGANDSTHQF